MALLVNICEDETFPSVIVANMFGFKQYPMFEITNEAERENVRVEFN